MQWASDDDLAYMVLTTQWIDAVVTSTGDNTLDGKRPSGIPDQRASLYADYRLSKGSLWTASISAEAVSKRATTFDDYAVLVSGYGIGQPVSSGKGKAGTTRPARNSPYRTWRTDTLGETLAAATHIPSMNAA